MKQFKFTIKGHNYEVEVRNFEGKFAEIEVNGTLYEVEVRTEKTSSKTPQLIRREIPRPKDAHVIKMGDGLHQVKAPLPGIVVQLKVKEGDEVKRGQKLLIYEAMKMENSLVSERNGTVKSIKVAAGDSILQGDILLELE